MDRSVRAIVAPAAHVELEAARGAHERASRRELGVALALHVTYAMAAAALARFGVAVWRTKRRRAFR